MAKNEVVEADKAMSLVKKFEASCASALPSHVTKEHFSRALQTCFRRTPDLMKCTPESLGGTILTAAQLGFMLGVNGSAWIVPFNNRKNNTKEAVLFIGYQGMVDLCYRSGLVESVCADIVCENDSFEYEQGLKQKLKHVPALKTPRGIAYAAYAIANIKGSNRPVYVLMNKDEIMTVKNASPAAKKSDSPWNGKFEYEMWKKTVLRRLTKLLPKSVELSTALEFENKQEQRMREVDASVVETDPADILKPGRHDTSKSKPKPEPKPDPVVTVDAQQIDDPDELKAVVKWIDDAHDNTGKEAGDVIATFGIKPGDGMALRKLPLAKLNEIKAAIDAVLNG